MKFTMRLGFASPSLNEVMDWKHNPKTRSWKYRQFKTDVAEELSLELASQRIDLSTRTQARVTFTRYSAGELDDDNLRGGMKPIRDALKDLGVIVDDTSKWLVAEYRQVKTKRGEMLERRTEIEVDLPGEGDDAYEQRRDKWRNR